MVDMDHSMWLSQVHWRDPKIMCTLWCQCTHGTRKFVLAEEAKVISWNVCNIKDQDQDHLEKITSSDLHHLKDQDH